MVCEDLLQSREPPEPFKSLHFVSIGSVRFAIHLRMVVNGTLEKYLGAEIGAWAMAYGLGKVVKSGTTPNFTYTCTPLIPASGDAAELPYFSFVEQIRPGAGVVVDRMAVGCVVEGWTLTVGSGPGRANSKISVEFVGSGKATEPSGITVPAATLEKLLPSASLALTTF